MPLARDFKRARYVLGDYLYMSYHELVIAAWGP